MARSLQLLPETGDTGDTEDDLVSSMEYDDTADREWDQVQQNEQGNKKALSDSFGNITFLKRNANFQKHDQNEDQVTGTDVMQRKGPRPFLKRGSGLARFKLSTDLSQLPCRVKRRPPNTRHIKSKYTEDTQAFANRKAQIRSSRDNLVQESSDSRPASAAPKMFRPRSSKNVANNKLSPVLKQIMNKKIHCEQGKFIKEK